MNFYLRYILLIFATSISCLALAIAFPTDSIQSLRRLAKEKPAEVILKIDSLRLQNPSQLHRAELLLIKGEAQTVLGDYNHALKSLSASYKAFDQRNNRNGKIKALCSLSSLKQLTGEYSKAEGYLKRALELSGKNDPDNLKIIYVSLGTVYDYMGKTEKAIYYYQKVIPYLERKKEYDNLAITYNNIATAYGVKGDFKKAEQQALKALEYQQYNKSDYTRTLIALNLGSLYLEKGKLREAFHYLSLGGEIAESIHSAQFRDAYYQNMIQYHRLLRDEDSALLFAEKLLQLRDTTYSYERRKIAGDIEARFQSNLKDKDIRILRVEKRLKEEALNHAEGRTIILLILSVLLVFCVVILFRNFRLKQAANKQLNVEKEELQRLNLHLEKEHLFAQFEILKHQISPHFLFNSLSVLNSLIPLDPVKAQHFTALFARIFRNVLELKDQHVVALKEELDHLGWYIELQRMRFEGSINVDIQVEAHYLSCIIPPFSLQMLVENAVKHNQASSDHPLYIRILTRENKLIVENSLNLRANVTDSTGTGLRNIVERFAYFTDLPPTFYQKEQWFVAELPLISESDESGNN